jgi:hypothetical protein
MKNNFFALILLFLSGVSLASEKDGIPIDNICELARNNDNSFYNILSKIESGDEYSFALGINNVTCLDGGNLEDLYRATGMFFDVKPAKFFKHVNSHNIKNETIFNMLSMLPLSLTDNYQAQIDLLSRRVSLLKSSCSDQKNISLLMERLKSNKDQLAKVMNDIKRSTTE